MKEYSPSDSRVADLRRAGIFPHSFAVLAFGGVLGSGLSFLIASQALPSPTELIATDSLTLAFFRILLGTFVAVLPIPVVTLGVGLLQSRFIVLPLWGGEGEDSSVEDAPALERFAIFVAGFGVFALLFGSALLDPATTTGPTLGLLRQTYGVVLGFSAFAALISYASAWLRFRLNHRMSRAELQAEAQEGQMRQDVRGMTQR